MVELFIDDALVAKASKSISFANAGSFALTQVRNALLCSTDVKGVLFGVYDGAGAGAGVGLV
jgi:hypothetical protein